MMRRVLMLGAIVVAAGAGAAGGYWWARRAAAQPPQEATSASVHGVEYTKGEPASAAGVSDARRVLYWYDPMYPSQHFDKPGKSPFMDMELVPRYAETDATQKAGTVRIDPDIAQNLGIRVAAVVSGTLPNRVEAAGTLQYNDRDLSVVQARTAGYVERVYAHAPGDLIEANSPLVDMLVPEWAGAQTEFLSLLRLGDAQLIAAARERLRLLGMPAGLIAGVERSRTLHTVFTVTTPMGGVVDTLAIRAGMTVAAGQTLATVRGIETVWLDVAVPEAQGSRIRTGDIAEAALSAYAGETLRGSVIAVLPAANSETRTITVRVQLDNPDGRLRPGMFATVRLTADEAATRLIVPSEALIRTGKRTLVMRVEADHRYRPVEIAAGRESDDRVEVLSGLRAGDQVVISGQFLIDSEASLAGVMARMDSPSTATPATQETLHETEGTVISVSDQQIELDHMAFTTLDMPAMQMPFRLAHPDVARGIEPGQRVRVGVRETAQGLVVERIERLGAPP